MMSLRLTPPLSLLFLLMVSGVVVSQDWGVYYTQSSICALKGSTVTVGCRYTYPAGYSVNKAFWSRELVTDKEPPDLTSDPKYRGRVQYLGDKRRDCSLRLSDVREQDQGKYYFRFITTFAEGKYQGKDGVNLSVTELQVEMIPDSVVEGAEVTLTCKTTCSLTVTPTFTWYKNGIRSSSASSFNPLRLPSVSQRDAGSYSCSVQGQSYRSPAVTLDVQYPPKRVSVSIRPSGEIVEGSSVTLSCSSDANPPVQTYTWYKGTSSIRTGQTYTISSISSEDSGEYTCQAENKHGVQSSTAASLNVLYPPKRVSVSIGPSGEIVEGSSVTLSCSSDANPPVQTYTWYKGTSSVRTGQTYTISSISSEDSGEYKCKVRHRYGEKYSDGATLNVLYPPKSVSVSISPSGEIVEGSSVTLTCSSDANPVEYNWFKGTLFKSKEKTYTINKISSEDSGDYKCKSSNQYGEKYSDGATLNVLYPPKNVSVSISHSGEIVEGSSVTLTCSSDANPPVQTYTWYKVDESSPVGSGHNYSFTLRFNSSRWFYCVAQNKYGNQTAAAVPLTLKGGTSVVLYVVLGVMVGCGCLFAIIGVLHMRRKKRGGSAEDAKSSQENIYSSENLSAATNNPRPDPDLFSQDDVQYASIQHQSDPRRAESSPLQTADSGAAEEVQYATVQHQHDRGVEKTLKDDDQYANVRFNRTGAAYRSAAPAFEDLSVIYSS
ncbi:B-cell receptor CD22 isoform X1 [Pangasianodon hypophthalmus]|uniref:B-cell receptor CD22 isoform X1 n=1 Tax=Pangasianodon hypophthalmus TaxID=310915 RepID=UPI00230705A2|nr:B-cell receptor CD22 isoform X1 [Pangasianodon hypophthalmus]